MQVSDRHVMCISSCLSGSDWVCGWRQWLHCVGPLRSEVFWSCCYKVNWMKGWKQKCNLSTWRCSFCSRSLVNALCCVNYKSSLTACILCAGPQIHSIHQRRKVVGRSKNFDQLVVELKTKVREKGAQSLEGGSSSGRSPSPEPPREQAGTPHCRRPLAPLPAFRSVRLTWGRSQCPVCSSTHFTVKPHTYKK